ncbi:MAG TPA: hypothetical protein VF455_05945 [Chryseobacterium sp.]|uniref:Uncharacterized protein n=1 Tax=Chryseobacterium formosus TaxID=1537363 RepID=A0ABT3XJX7_9FLAO|nr:hypothetical protein [Chryseobacterium formosus]MCX8522443.1 hypothetical protein [Chryseobacterium formosus]
MVKIKLLEIKDREVLALKKCYPEFVKALNNVLGYTVETVFELDDSFEGYYLTPVGGAAFIAEKYKTYITEKSFLLGAYNADIPNYIERFKPAGLTNWQLFIKASTAVIGKTEVIEKVYSLEEGDNILYEDLGYDDYVPIPFDNTYETAAKAILSYLEVYDKWLKNK